MSSNVNEEELIKEILLKYKNIATIGFSKDPSKPAFQVPKFLMEHGYNVIPVNPSTNEILGKKSYPSILDVPDKVEVVEIFRPSSEIPKIVDQILERVKRVGDVKVIWMQEGIRHDESAEKARKMGLIVIQDRCMYKEYMKKIQRV
ncbi:CoA-binding protein [Sulfolobus sp. A20]|uniref:CoA-binding protein n=1 Tax=Saccharolobus sp. A20 TaxID=1891280 RepID=UPI000845D03A|nr:CoA-binding protein [Sulfolobus sp. A20]TRM75926.1 CoA-binding protein [Sulfolobus sp. B5]TRM77040.1 CoA-binding protein [Sulfolobus sp. A20-N-F8]TRM81016.1 CoA-binding protein [Sulfolobus sp. D5]TRM83750.1 CoA-binding protein [Sulfolobus sp. A20-N-F6]TRM97223.1 CoA-binding protein [Sulfolobus sp. B1]TRM98333.1 CoA-binding protein [Sulfolobus sp. F1]TRM99124.1 CoA-binding protein [Sulfolobus sp. E1]